MSTIIGAETTAKVETQPRGKLSLIGLQLRCLHSLWGAEELGS